MDKRQDTYWEIVWKQFRHHRLGLFSLVVVIIFGLVGIYAPFLASSKPLAVQWEGQWYFPFFTYLFHTGFYTKRLDLFYNILMFTLPLALLGWSFRKVRWLVIGLLSIAQGVLFVYFGYYYTSDPASDGDLNNRRYEALQSRVQVAKEPLLAPLEGGPSWEFDLSYMNDYGKLNAIIRYHLRYEQYQRLQQYKETYRDGALNRWLVQQIVAKKRSLTAQGVSRDAMPDSNALRAMVLAETPPEVIEQVTMVPSLWQAERDNEEKQIEQQRQVMASLEERYQTAKQTLIPLLDKCRVLLSEKSALREKAEVERWRLAQLRIRIGGGPSQLAATIEETIQKIEERCDAIGELTDGERLQVSQLRQVVERYEVAHAKIRYILDRRAWLDENREALGTVVMPLIRSFHWEDDAGGEQSINKFLPWYERTRINRKDMLAALLFGIRISIVVGILSVGLAVAVGVPIGAFAGYYGGKFDIVVSRILEIWESMPTFFMLLLVVAITQSKSIFLVIGVIGLFGWTGFSRYIRGEVLKQRNLAYVEASHALGYPDRRIIFHHILPNAIPPLLTLLPFAIMGAITSEAGLSFLGLGEEGSCSWGVLMDEGRSAFPGESYLLWPPALLLTTLLVAIALLGDALRDSLDPKMRR